MKQATRPAKGFGSKTFPKSSRKAAVVSLVPEVQAAISELAEGEQSIKAYMNPKLFEDPAMMRNVAERLRANEVVVLRNAFCPAFAEMMHAELKSKDVAWELNEAYFEDGYHHRHHNVYDQSTWSARLTDALGVFSSAASAEYMQHLTGRDCSGEVTGAPSWYKAGDHSLPHTDWVGQRTVSYVWHLSKNWRPEWGGALYWAQDDHAVATYPASFNTLVLFSVTTRSAHFVTTVSPHHKGKRLTFNGWWQSSWVPSLADNLEAVLSSPERCGALTHTQLQAITDLLSDPWQNIEAGRREVLQKLRLKVVEEFFPRGARAGLEA
eukprot:CAMPEP_0183358426 /NCGR_PEP_ID=MMETSP0164_2-20130417/49185_1 /TAXON_ID=221442 /ORGANISM="Coccolithus pelagicus ssp braarudi, Strain PLY182g" /LENGTH=322 /DNA_ID=CAMNT_0025532325 /DNA_START=99 /DNA_END=1067 /DNA_ORIENTATION=+